MLRSQHDSLVMLFNFFLLKKKKRYTFCQASTSISLETPVATSCHTGLKALERQGTTWACVLLRAARDEASVVHVSLQCGP